LPLDHHGQRGGRGAMASAGVEENKVEALHWSGIVARRRGHRAASNRLAAKPVSQELSPVFMGFF
jgi:hypothetical protein